MRFVWMLRWLRRRARRLGTRLGDIVALWLFTLDPRLAGSLLARARLAAHFARIQRDVPCAHRQWEILRGVRAVLRAPRDASGVVVECGAYRGGGTAKLSLACRLAGRRLLVFDTFEGLPDEEPRVAQFRRGAYAGGKADVRGAVERHGAAEVVTLVPGLFADTMAAALAREHVVVAYLDVDLAASTRDAMEALWPRMAAGGVVVSQDGAYPWCVDQLRLFGPVHGSGRVVEVRREITAARTG